MPKDITRCRFGWNSRVTCELRPWKVWRLLIFYLWSSAKGHTEPIVHKVKILALKSCTSQNRHQDKHAVLSFLFCFVFIIDVSVFFTSRLSVQCSTSWLTELSAKAVCNKGGVLARLSPDWAADLFHFLLSLSLSFFCFIRYFGIINIKYYLWPPTRNGLKHFRIPNFTT